MKSLEDKGILFKISALLFVAVITIVGPITFVVLMGWAKFEFNSAVVIAIILFCLFMLASVLIFLGIDKNITSKETDIRINKFFSQLTSRYKPYIIISYFIVLILLVSYYVYLQFD